MHVHRVSLKTPHTEICETVDRDDFHVRSVVTCSALLHNLCGSSTVLSADGWLSLK